MMQFGEDRKLAPGQIKKASDPTTFKLMQPNFKAPSASDYHDLSTMK
jgi:hypothetical protein